MIGLLAASKEKAAGNCQRIFMSDRAPAHDEHTRTAINYIALGLAISAISAITRPHHQLVIPRQHMRRTRELAARQQRQQDFPRDSDNSARRHIAAKNPSPLAMHSAMCMCELLFVPSKVMLLAKLRISVSPEKRRGWPAPAKPRMALNRLPMPEITNAARGSWSRVPPLQSRRASPGPGPGGWGGFALMQP